MTTNNLQEHISWLLTDRPFVPPAQAPIPPNAESTLSTALQSQPLRSIHIPQDDLLDELSLTPGTPADAPDRAIGPRFIRPPPPNQEHTERQEPVATFNVEQTGNEMVRLQAGPTSAGKSRLISQAVPQLATPATIAVSRKGDSITDRYSAQFQRTIQDTPSIRRTAPLFPTAHRQHLPTPLSRPEERILSDSQTRKLDVDAIDLTEKASPNTSSSGTIDAFGESKAIWSEDCASRVEPLSKLGKKRKSDELGFDAILRPAPGRAGPFEVELSNSARPICSDFIAIDSYSDYGPPPPYSTVPSQPQQTGIKPVDTSNVVPSPRSASIFDDRSEHEEYSFAETRIRTETWRTKSLSRVPSNTRLKPYSSSPRKACLRQEEEHNDRLIEPASSSLDSSQMRIKRTTSLDSTETKSKIQGQAKRPRKQVIADSEDDEDELGDTTITKPMIRQNKLDWNEMESSTVSEAKQPQRVDRSTLSDAVQEHLPNERAPELSMSSALPVIMDVDPPHRLNDTTIASHLHVHSPTKSNSVGEDRESSSANIPPSSELPDEDKKAVKWFLGLNMAQIEDYLKGFESTQQANTESLYCYLVETGQAPPHLEELGEVLRQKIEAMKSLVRAKERHEQVSRAHHDLKPQLIAAIKAGRNRSSYQTDLRKNQNIVKVLKRLEADIARLLPQAAISSTLADEDVQVATQEPATPMTKCINPTECVVQSTQAQTTSGGTKFRTFFSAGITEPSQTQFICQTQSPQAVPGTPLHRTRTLTSAPSPKPTFTSSRGPTFAVRDMDEDARARSRTLLRTLNPPPNAKDVSKYISPSKGSTKARDTPRGPYQNYCSDYQEEALREPSFPRSPRRFPYGISPTNSDEDRAPMPALQSENPYDEHFGGSDIFEDYDEEYDEPTRDTRVGQESCDDVDECGYDDDEDDDDELLEAVHCAENQPNIRGSNRACGHREPFTNISGNVACPDSMSTAKSVHTSQKAFSTITVPEKSLLQHPWSRDVRAALKARFHLHGFRQNQLEAINATLGGQDTFVLMPTGGGKSLCYQLPSVVKSGKTRGVTIVISPLLSLMQDQVEHLQKLKIQAFLINGEVTPEHRRLILSTLKGPNVEQFIQLLYVTPEMLSKNQSMVNALCDLHRQERLARIVIDEAHCVSQWGHDFRPDYKTLGEVRQKFQGVPLMALTATATENVKLDVIHNLGMDGCQVYTQSFNRPNLTYEVRPKGKLADLLERMAELIQSSYSGQSGIIYCLSRKNCEKVAKQLVSEYNIKAHHYHAGMEPADKARVQRQWQAGKYNIIVATIAFGMGIDKPDVRFIIHHSIPKSLEGYYQETGRAGRDGKTSGCYLYYGYQDTTALKRMIDEGDGSPEQKDRQYKMLRDVVQFCENKSDCRRVEVLRYFNEPFRPEDCNHSCDNCNSNSIFESKDFTGDASSAIKLVKRMIADKKKVTLLQCVDVFRGSKNPKIKKANFDAYPEYGAGKNLKMGEGERLFYRLVSEEALKEENVQNKSGFPIQYLQLGRHFKEFMSGQRQLRLQIRVSPNGKGPAPKKSTKARSARTGVGVARHDYPQSTNVSSPIQAASRRRPVRKMNQVEDEERHPNGYARDNFVVSDGDSDGFEDVRIAGKARKSPAKRQLGPPITTDQKMEELNPIHRLIVDEFVQKAKAECDKILFSKNLRAHPFTDSVLREMAINFPRDEHDMLKIPDMDPKKVELYGKRFLKLIRLTENHYESMMRTKEDRPHDPNHQIVIELSSDNEEETEASDTQSEGGSQEEPSPYFQLEPRVERFNAQMSQTATYNAANSSRTDTRGGTRGSRSDSKRRFRKGSGGVSKGKSNTRSGTTSARTSNGSSSNFFGRGGGGRGGASSRPGIGMMPT